MASRSNYQSYTLARQNQIQQMMAGKFRETLKPDDFNLAELAPRQEDLDHEAYMEELEHRENHPDAASPTPLLEFSKQTIVSPSHSSSSATHHSQFSQQLASQISGSRGSRSSDSESAFAAYAVVGGGLGGVGTAGEQASSPISASLLPQPGSTRHEGYSRVGDGITDGATSTTAAVERSASAAETDAGFYHANRFADAAKNTERQCRVYLDLQDGKELAANCTAIRLIQQTLAIAFDEDLGMVKDKPGHLNDASLYQVFIGEKDGEVDEDFPALGADAIVSKQKVDAFVVRLQASAAAAVAGSGAPRGSAVGSVLAGPTSYLTVKTQTNKQSSLTSPSSPVRPKTPGRAPASKTTESKGQSSPSVDLGDYNRTKDFAVGARPHAEEDAEKHDKKPHVINPYGGSVRGGGNKDSSWNKLFRFS